MFRLSFWHKLVYSVTNAQHQTTTGCKVWKKCIKMRYYTSFFRLKHSKASALSRMIKTARPKRVSMSNFKSFFQFASKGAQKKRCFWVTSDKSAHFWHQRTTMWKSIIHSEVSDVRGGDWWLVTRWTSSLYPGRRKKGQSMMSKGWDITARKRVIFHSSVNCSHS